jgi:hypothetical protein
MNSIYNIKTIKERKMDAPFQKLVFNLSSLKSAHEYRKKLVEKIREIDLSELEA